MKKKLFLLLTIFVVAVSLVGCGNSTYELVRKNMSEITRVYFYGESDDFCCSISSGEREKIYMMDGKISENVDFALISLSVAKQTTDKIIKINLSINGDQTVEELEINPLNSQYMLDLEQKFDGTEKITIEFDGQQLDLTAISNDFEVDSNKALEIASNELKDKILLKKNFNHLNAEGYLRVLDKKANGFEQTYWCYSILNVDEENYSIIISTKDGTILAKSE